MGAYIPADDNVQQHNLSQSEPSSPIDTIDDVRGVRLYPAEVLVLVLLMLGMSIVVLTRVRRGALLRHLVDRVWSLVRALTVHDCSPSSTRARLEREVEEGEELRRGRVSLSRPGGLGRVKKAGMVADVVIVCVLWTNLTEFPAIDASGWPIEGAECAGRALRALRR